MFDTNWAFAEGFGAVFGARAVAGFAADVDFLHRAAVVGVVGTVEIFDGGGHEFLCACIFIKLHTGEMAGGALAFERFGDRRQREHVVGRTERIVQTG